MAKNSAALGASSIFALAIGVCGCATKADVEALRHPTLPPTSVALSDPGEQLFRNVAIYEITGAPEFRLFDGNDLYTTRPTRADVARMLRTWLNNADIAATDVAHAKYLLSIRFEDLHGPDVIFFTDKHADSRTRYIITDARTGEVVFDQTYESNFRARMPGVTPEMVRAGIVGGILGGVVSRVTNDASEQYSGLGAVAGIGPIAGAHANAWAATHQATLWDLPGSEDENWPSVESSILSHFEMSVLHGVVIGGLTAFSGDDSDHRIGDVKAGTLGAISGGLSAFIGAEPIGKRPDHFDSPDMIGPWGFGNLGGTQRRHLAVHGMMLQNFDKFLFGLSEHGFLKIRQAVPCTDLNPNAEKHGYGVAIVMETRTAVGYDCPVDPHARSRTSSIAYSQLTDIPNR
jgi:hypothetical protein